MPSDGTGRHALADERPDSSGGCACRSTGTITRSREGRASQMKNRRRTGKARSGAQLVAATSLAAAGTLGAALGSAALAGAANSTKIFACYSTKTNALSYDPKGAKCASGETLISWNASGPQGARGAKGSRGAIGAQGAKGAQGAQGATGPQGAQGGAGPQGAIGAQGAAGANGAQGSAGPQGSTGPQGAPGTKGTQGSPGTQGAQGAQGPAGVVGFLAQGQLKLATGLLKGVPTARPQVVESFQTGSGDYAINATITGRGVTSSFFGAGASAEFSCWVRDKSIFSSPSGGRTSTIESQTAAQSAFVVGGGAANDTVDGFLFPADSGSTIQLVCEVQPRTSSHGTTYADSANVHATMMATRLTTVTTTGSASKPLRNRFHVQQP